MKINKIKNSYFNNTQKKKKNIYIYIYIYNDKIIL